MSFVKKGQIKHKTQNTVGRRKDPTCPANLQPQTLSEAEGEKKVRDHVVLQPSQTEMGSTQCEDVQCQKRNRENQRFKSMQ